MVNPEGEEVGKHLRLNVDFDAWVSEVAQLDTTHTILPDCGNPQGGQLVLVVDPLTTHYRLGISG